jgi:chromosome segregation ATPase
VPELTRIVVVSDEELFIEFMERFSPKTIQLHYAADLTEASQYCEDTSLGLLVVPVDGPQSLGLEPLLTETACCDVRVLGLGDNDGPSKLPQVDRVAPAADHEAVFRAAAELLNERRSWPRVAYELTVEIGGMGSLVTSTISAVSLFVETSAPLEVDQRLKIRLRHGSRAPGGEATVVRVGLGESGNMGMVLAVTEESKDLRAFLETKLREALRFEHRRQQGAHDLPPAPVVPGLETRPTPAPADKPPAIKRHKTLTDLPQPPPTGEMPAVASDGEAHDAPPLQLQIKALAKKLQELREQIEVHPAERRLGQQIAQASRVADALEARAELQQAKVDDLAQQQEQILSSNKDLGKLVQHHDEQVLALGSGLGQMVEHTANLDLTVKETESALRRRQLESQEQAQEQAQQAQARFEALETLVGRIEALEARPDEALSPEALTQQLDQASGEATRQLEALRQQTEQQLEQASKQTEQQLEEINQQSAQHGEQLQTLLEPLQGDLAELAERLAELSGRFDTHTKDWGLQVQLSQVAEQVVELTGRFDAHTRDEGPQQELAQVAEQVAELSSRLDAHADDEGPQQELAQLTKQVAELGSRLDAYASDEGPQQELAQARDELLLQLEVLEGRLEMAEANVESSASREALDSLREALGQQLEQAQQQTAQQLEQAGQESTQQLAELTSRFEVLADDSTPLSALNETRAELEKQQKKQLKALSGQLEPLAQRVDQLQQASEEAAGQLQQTSEEAAGQVEGLRREMAGEFDQVRKDAQQQQEQLLAQQVELENQLQQQREQQRELEQLRREAAEQLREELGEQLGQLAEQQLRRHLDPLQDEVNAAAQRLEEQSGRLEALDNDDSPQQALAEARTALQQALDELDSRCQALDGRIRETSTREAADAMEQALTRKMQQLAERLEQSETLASAAATKEDLETAQQELAARLEQSETIVGAAAAKEDLETVQQELTARLEQSETLAEAAATKEDFEEAQQVLGQQMLGLAGRLEQAETRVDASVTTEALEAREQALVQQLEGLAERLESLNQENATALSTFEEIRVEMLDIMDAMVQRVEEVADRAATTETLAELQQDLGKHETLAKKVSSSVSTLGQRVEELDKLRSQLRVTDERSRELSGRMDKERASWEGLQKRIDEQTKVVSRVVQRLDKLSD